MNDSHAAKIDVNNIALLSKLTFTDAEQEKLESDMSSIISFANTLSELDVSGVCAREHLTNSTNVCDEDMPVASFDRAELFANAKTKTEQFITVPRVVE